MPLVRVPVRINYLELFLLFNLFHAMILCKRKLHVASLADSLQVNIMVAGLNKETIHCC